ncbi:hypothetical protein C1T31_08785 [Hanstruepera neustonica]|uniref:Uncharacterized protein n=2 Tax=Hanstruepera neustonica TaxID=1445657 RepID=A0A2K1DYH5_9FLAO|nr:hypothetical protein C1T31_08785 [Hanstruepera neustonica]
MTSQDLALAMTETKSETVLTCKKGPLEYSLFDQPDLNRELFAVAFRAEAQSHSLYNLIVDMRLKDGGHFVSPNATGYFSGKFTMVIDDTDAFEVIGKLIENPLTKEELDLHPFINGPVNWVRENTTYTQQIQLNTENSFEVHGYIQFTIEPACTLEKIPFIIKQNDGVLKFEFFGC